MPYSRITTNLVGAQKRYETLEGKQYLVVPTVALTVGVHNGSQGPLLYLPDELSKNPMSWNAKPITNDHPALNGEGVTACDPQVIESQGTGRIFNAAWDGRLKWDSWIDEDKLKRINPTIHNALQDNKPVEVSTGLYHDLEMKEGTWNGERYVGIVRNILPDHLAIFSDKKGACSIADGAGLLRNAAGESTEGLSHDDIRCQISKLLRENRKGPNLICDDFCYVCDVYPKSAVFESKDKCYKIGYKVKGGKVALEGEPEEVRKMTSYVTANGQMVRNEDHQGPIKLPKPSADQLSEPMRKQQMEKALAEKYSGIQQTGDWGGWVVDLVANYAIYSKDGKWFRLPYTYDDDKINFDGEPEEVERVSEYRTRRQTPIDGSSSPYNVNQSRESTMPNPQGSPTQNVIHQGAGQMIHDATHHMDAHHPPGGASDSQLRASAGGARKQEVDTLIAHHGWDEQDRKFLEGLPDDHFQKVQGYSKKGYAQPIVPYTYEGVGDRSNVHMPKAGHAETANAQQVTAEQYIANAPPGIREVLAEGVAAHNSQKGRLIQIITSNVNNVFNPEWLKTRSIPELRGIARLAHGQQQLPSQQPVMNYAGQGEVAMFLQNQQQPTDNSVLADEEVLQLPSMGFEVKNVG